VAVRLEEFIDVDEVGALAGADHQVEVVVLSPPDLPPAVTSPTSR
jgi:hypothetical protein